MSIILSPSLLSADFGNLQRDIELINSSEADWIHVDVMDGVFVPNISFGQPVIQGIKKYAKKPLDVHLMIVDPDRYIDDFQRVGADILTVHYEACKHLNRTVSYIKSKGMKAGVSLNPHTPVELLSDIITEIDLVLIMSVNPGFGGQKFIETSYDKISRLKKLITDKKANVIIEVDGGVDLSNVQKLINCGANTFVAGNAIFKSGNPEKTIKEFKAF